MADGGVDPKYTPWFKHYGDVPKHIDVPEESLYGMVKATSEKYPEKIAYMFMGDKTRYKTFIAQIDDFALRLVKLGVTSEDKLLICMPNCPQAVVALYAANKIGAVATMIHPLSA